MFKSKISHKSLFIYLLLENIQVGSWNTRGFGDLHRCHILREWLRKRYSKLDILCLQELMTDEDTIKFQLNMMFPGGTIVLDSTENGRVNSMIVASPKLDIIGIEKKRDSSMMWVTVSTPSGPMNFCSVYAPTKKESMIEFWRWLEQLFADEMWVFSGDFNMVDLLEDTKGKFTYIRGS